MSAAVRRTSRQSGAVYNALRVISHQMPPRGRGDKFSETNLIYLRVFSSSIKVWLTGVLINDLQLILIWTLFKKTGAFDSRLVNLFEQLNSPFGEAGATHWTTRTLKKA